MVNKVYNHICFYLLKEEYQALLNPIKNYGCIKGFVSHSRNNQFRCRYNICKICHIGYRIRKNTIIMCVFELYRIIDISDFENNKIS